MGFARASAWLLGSALIVLAAPALADVKAGVDAWSRGEWDRAVAEWQGPAAQGDPDAMFNLGQAYRLGRGVPKDQARAEQLYAAAAQQGHLQAADTYGLLLFQDGRRAEALPYVQDAARRGDPRAEYLLGVAHFNGDLVGKDWVRAYALVSLANGQGLPQAAPALAEMDRFIPLEQRQQASGLAVQLQNEAEAARARELASADLGRLTPQAKNASVSYTPSAPAQNASVPYTPAAPVAVTNTRLPRPIEAIEVAPSVAEARAAVAQAMQATGTEDPALAGADFARPRTAAPAPIAVAVAQPAPVAPRPAAPAPAAPTASGGPWKVQLGAFSVSGNAERLWASLSGRPELRGKNRLLVPVGGLTKLLAGGFATKADAAAACQRLQASGQACIVTQ